MAKFHDFTKPFKILTNKKVGDIISKKDHPNCELEFLILSTGFSFCPGFQHIVRTEFDATKYEIISLPWQNL